MKKVFIILSVFAMVGCTTETSTEATGQESSKFIKSDGEVVEVSTGDILYLGSDTIEIRQSEEGSHYMFQRIQLTESKPLDAVFQTFPVTVEEVVLE